MNNKEELERAERQTETNPTKLQKESGNYPKGKVKLNGIALVIENPKGSVRSGVDSSGEEWECTMVHTYGFIEGTVGSDKDEIDVFIGPLVDDFSNVFLVNQITPSTGLFDEHKVLLGFNTIEEAKAAYLSSYTPGWKGLGSIKQLSLSEFTGWLDNKIIPNSMIEKVPKLRTIQLEGEVIADVTLPDLIKQAGDLDSFDSLCIEIASPGGDVAEGIYIMMWLDTLSEMGKEVTTVVTANAYSIASLIMLAANKKKIARHAKVMVHNPMKPELTLVNANDLEVFVKELRDLEKTMYILYKLFTGIDEEKIKSLMDNETYLTAEEAVQFGFADEIVDMKQRPDSVAINKPSKINMKSTLNILNSVIAMVKGSAVVNQLYYDTTGGELEIFQKDPASYEEGDKTSVTEGVKTLSDGSTITIEDSTITKIERGMEAPIAVVEEPAMVDPIVEPVMADHIEPAMVEGPVPVDPLVAVVEELVVAVEAIIPPAMVEPIVEPAMVVEPVAPAMVIEEPAMAVEPAVAEPDIMSVIKGMEETIVALKGRIQALEDGGAEVVEALAAQSKFEALATEAIDTIAKNTVSNFAPTERSAVTVAPAGGSIFAQMKARTQAAK
jgi:ATP-dependent protease ClpP protease subunit